MALGIYISVPFCRTKCSYCNFASGVFARSMVERYVNRVCDDITRAELTATRAGAILDRQADSIYLGGGTPTTLPTQELKKIFAAVCAQFDVLPSVEVTVECAPGTLTPERLDSLLECGVNRVSLGVQSFVAQEATAVGRLHDRDIVRDDIARLRAAGITNLNLDLIAGLPHQSMESWRASLEEAIATQAPHVSVYMLEVDEDSRLGRELIAGGTRYHAHFVPDDDRTADLYKEACARLEKVGIAQYEISNFARPGMESQHNLKYWTRQPYGGFGLDAHSMLSADPYLLVGKTEGQSSAACMLAGVDADAVRLATPDVLERYVEGAPPEVTIVSERAAIEETFFLGLRLNRGVNLQEAARLGSLRDYEDVIQELTAQGLLDREGDVVRLTARGRLLSNEVFQRFIGSTYLSS